MIDFKVVSAFFDYNPETGVITWKVNRSRGVKPGDIAGYVNSAGYRVLRLFGRGYQAHRIAWLLTYKKWPVNQLDHENHARDDNRLCNLRIASALINAHNKKLGVNNSSGVMGVNWKESRNKWEVRIMKRGKRKNLAYTDDFFEACCVRKAAEIEQGFHPNHGKQYAVYSLEVV